MTDEELLAKIKLEIAAVIRAMPGPTAPVLGGEMGGEMGGDLSARSSTGGWLFATDGSSTAPFVAKPPQESWKYLFPINAPPTFGPPHLPIPHEHIPAITGTRFPDGGWDPLLKAGYIASLFAARMGPHADGKKSGWDDIDPGPPEAHSSDPAKRIKALTDDLSKLAAYMLDPMFPWEIADIKNQAVAFAPYFAALLACSTEFRPATYSLIMIGVQVGGVAVTYFKFKYERARPFQVWPAMVPMIRTPRHPSYPSGHALQSFLIARFAAAAMPSMKEALDNLADSIAHNRERARVHYPSDTKASQGMVENIWNVMAGIKQFQDILALAKAESRGAETFHPVLKDPKTP